MEVSLAKISAQLGIDDAPGTSTSQVRTSTDTHKLPRSGQTSIGVTQRGGVEAAGRSSQAMSAEKLDSRIVQEDRFNLDMRLLPVESALQRIEQSLNSIALESNLQRCEMGTVVHQESTESVLAKLEEHLGMSKHRFTLQSILTKVEMHLDTMQGSGYIPIVEPLLRKIELQLQSQHETATEMLVAKVERKLNMSQSMRQVQSEFACLIGKYEQRLNAEMNRGVSAMQTLSAIIRPGLVRQGPDIRPAASWAQPHFENRSMSSASVPPGADQFHIGVGDAAWMNSAGAQVDGLTVSARGATGGTLE